MVSPTTRSTVGLLNDYSCTTLSADLAQVDPEVRGTMLKARPIGGGAAYATSRGGQERGAGQVTKGREASPSREEQGVALGDWTA